MKALTSALLIAGLLLPFPADAAKGAKGAEHPGVRCRRLQRTAQTIVAVEGFEAARTSGGRRAGHRPRKIVRNLVGYSVKRKTVGRGCFRCITRQFRRHVPIAKQLACGAHDVCVAGAALPRSLSPCVDSVCDANSSCCHDEWGAGCIASAKEVCGAPCNPCSHDPCESGDALDPTCSACAAQICNTDPFCCDTLWSDECVAKIEITCGQTCGATSSSLPPTSSTLPTETTVPSSDGTLPAPSSTLPDGGSTVPGETLPSPVSTVAGGTLPPTTVEGATTTVGGGATTTLQSPGSTLVETPTDDNCTNVLDFDDEEPGHYVCDEQTSLGQPVAIKGTNPGFTPGANAAVLFDSSCASGKCTGGDPDLGCPNQGFGGPGVGDGGASGQPFANTKAHGNVLIVAADLIDEDGDGLVDDPDDQSSRIVRQEFDFAAFAPTSVLGLTVIDVESSEQPASIELFGMLGDSLGKFPMPSTGNNGVAEITLPANSGVWKMIVTLRGSGALDEIRLACSGATTTTIGGQTTTTVPVTTTLVGPTTTQPGPTTTLPGGTTTLPPVTTTLPGTTTLPPVTTTLPGTTTLPPVTTTQPPVTTTVPVTTTLPPVTTTVPVTTTLPPPSECPSSASLALVAATREDCATNADCEVGTCNTTLGRCHTRTELDTGWTGIAHDADITDNVVILANLDCPGQGPACGQCNVAGLDPEPGNCRCVNDNQIVCNTPFGTDAACGGQACVCYLGPPLALSAGNTPACVVNKFSQDVSGTTNVDTGAGAVNVRLRSVVYLGESLTIPCPYCLGDVTPADGVKDGTCQLGEDAGDKCDDNGTNLSFPAPGGDGHSLDCFPLPGKNVSGAGLIINLAQTTGSVSLNSDVLCGFPPAIPQQCHCGLCSNDSALPCEKDADCGTGNTCVRKGAFDPSPNACGEATCTDLGNGEAECQGTNAPVDKGCNGVLRSNGDFFIQCNNNGDCAPENIGVDAGDCTLSKQRECFLPTISAVGTPDPKAPVGVATFCVPATANPGINSVAGLPGPGRVISQGLVTTLCSGGEYVPNVGCP